MEKIFLNNKRGPLPGFLRDEVKKKFLLSLAETNRIGAACEAAGICRKTAWNWRNSGYITEQELLECRAVYEEILETGLNAEHFGRRSRTNVGKDPFENASGRRLLSMAKSVLPEFGGRSLHTVCYNTQGWTPAEKADIYNRIREIQARHRAYR